MIRRATGVWLTLFGIYSFWVSAAPAQEAGMSPPELNKKAYFLIRAAQQSLAQKDQRAAYDKYLEVVEVYRKISGDFPDWRPAAVQVRIEEFQEKAEQLARVIFKIPEEYIELKPGMTREGKRYYMGESLRSKVRKVGEDHYRVDDFTVTLLPLGPHRGVKCSCPDFKYRGAKYNFPCPHIWAVILKANLLPEEKN